MFFKDKKPEGTQEETTRIWFKVVYVFDRLSRDLRLSLCMLDGIQPARRHHAIRPFRQV
jgi:hypothetical protein